MGFKIKKSITYDMMDDSRVEYEFDNTNDLNYITFKGDGKESFSFNVILVKQLIETFEIGWKANVKARIHSAALLNQYRKRGDEKPFRAQQEMYNYYQNKLDVIAEELQ